MRFFVATHAAQIPADVTRFLSVDGSVPGAVVTWDHHVTGERVNLDMRLVLGSLIVPSNVTNLSACDSGGNSWLNVFDAATGGEVPGSPYRAGTYMPGAVTVGISLIRGRSGRILSILTKSDDTQQVTEVQTQQGAPLGRRSGWRDLLD